MLRLDPVWSDYDPVRYGSNRKDSLRNSQSFKNCNEKFHFGLMLLSLSYPDVHEVGNIVRNSTSWKVSCSKCEKLGLKNSECSRKKLQGNYPDHFHICDFQHPDFSTNGCQLHISYIWYNPLTGNLSPGGKLVQFSKTPSDRPTLRRFLPTCCTPLEISSKFFLITITISKRNSSMTHTLWLWFDAYKQIVCSYKL